jgi:hypothetical protein
MMDIDGLGERYIDKLVEYGYVHSVADLYRLTLDNLLDMKRRADEDDGVTPETVKAARWPASGQKTCWKPLPPAAPRRWRVCCLRWAFAMLASPPPRRWPTGWAHWR